MATITRYLPVTRTREGREVEDGALLPGQSVRIDHADQVLDVALLLVPVGCSGRYERFRVRGLARLREALTAVSQRELDEVVRRTHREIERACES